MSSWKSSYSVDAGAPACLFLNKKELTKLLLTQNIKVKGIGAVFRVEDITRDVYAHSKHPKILINPDTY